MSGKWTPGPWHTSGIMDEYYDGYLIVACRKDCGPAPGNPSRGMVASTCNSVPRHREQTLSNARLIAAAPELAEALEACLNYIENTEGELGTTLGSGDKARAALAKAKGEPV